MIILTSNPQIDGTYSKTIKKDNYKVMWKSSPEFSILHYLIAYQVTDSQRKTTESKESSVRISGLKAGSMVQLKAIN